MPGRFMFYAVDPVIAIRPAPWYNGTHECKGGAQMAIAYLKSGKEARVLQGNPWVFRSDIDRVSGAWEPGDVVSVKSARGRMLGCAFYNPQS